MMNRFDITLDEIGGLGCRILLGGVDITQKVRALKVEAEAGELTRVTLSCIGVDVHVSGAASVAIESLIPALSETA